MQGSLLYNIYNWVCGWIVHLRALFCLLEVSNFSHGPWMKASGLYNLRIYEQSEKKNKQGKWEYKNLFRF